MDEIDASDAQRGERRGTDDRAPGPYMPSTHHSHRVAYDVAAHRAYVPLDEVETLLADLEAAFKQAGGRSLKEEDKEPEDEDEKKSVYDQPWRKRHRPDPDARELSGKAHCYP